MLRAAKRARTLLCLATQAVPEQPLGARHKVGMLSKDWHWLKEKGVDLNPCNSPLHPAVLAGAIEVAQGQTMASIQEAYTPHSTCFGCGPESDAGLQLRSFRSKDGLTASVRLRREFQAFPGIITGGTISTLMDCHGNWTAAVALMDSGRLSKPPLTVTKEMLVQYLEPTPPDQDLILVSTVSSVEEFRDNPDRRDTVQVDLQLIQLVEGEQESGKERTFARGTGRFKKIGALRAL